MTAILKPNPASSSSTESGSEEKSNLLERARFERKAGSLFIGEAGADDGGLRGQQLLLRGRVDTVVAGRHTWAGS